MGQTTVRIPDELLEQIDEATADEESRSEWIREACRERLSEQEIPERVDELEQRVNDLERAVEEPLLSRLFG